MHEVVMGAKGGSKGQRQPKVANDTTASKTYARLQYGMSEGEVEGFANGYQSIYLDDTPVESEGGAKNFQDLTLDFRTGTNDQTYMEGFESIASESTVGIELKSGTPWVKGVTNLNLDAVIVRVRFGALKQQDPSNGDVTGVKIDYSIEVQTDGGSWELMLDTQMSGKTSANYERTHRIGLPKANKNWLIRVTRKTPNSTSEYVSDKMYVQAITEIVDLKLAYPNTALIGVQYDAETFSNIAKLAVEMKGIKIKVPSNYDPVSRTYVGIWNGLFKRAYTNNPAWIYYDLCTAKNYALGNRLTEQMIDKWSLYRLAQYCDQLVPDGKGGEEPRFSCNVYIQNAEAAFDILTKLTGLFRAINYWDGTSIVCGGDLPQDTYFTYTRANVIDGQFEYAGTRARDRHNAVKVAWDNPQNRYKTEYVFVRDEEAIAEAKTINMLDLEAWGCTSEGQAQRTGQWALKSEQLETRTVSFKVGLDGHIPLPGKVIEIADELFAGRANGGRIAAVSKDRKSITLDRDDIVCRAGDRLVVNGEDGKAQARVVVSLVGRVVRVVSAFDSVAAQNVWVVDAKDLATMKFRVISITQNDQHQFSITALEHNPSKFDAIDHGAFIDERPISIIQPTTQIAVESVTISSEQMVQQGLSVATMIISWPQAKDATKYQVEWRKDHGTWLKLPLTGSNSAEVAGIYAGKYEARVIAISAFEISSLPTYSKLTELKGKQGKPPNLAFIRATGVLFGMKIDWGFPTTGALDTAYVEINVSPDGKSNIAELGLFAYPTTTHTIQGLQPNLKQFYQGRLIDRIGNKGDWSNWVSGTTTSNAKDVLDLLHEQISESQLNQDLQTKVGQIELIDAEIPKLQKDIKDTRDQIAQESKDRLKEANLIKQDVERTKEQIGLETEARIEDADLIKQDVQKTKEQIESETKDRKRAIQDSEDGLTKIIDQKNKDTLHVVDTLKQSTDEGFVAVQSEMKLITDGQKLLSEKTEGVYAQLNPQLAGSTTDMAGNGEMFAGTWSLQSAMIEGDLALSKRVDTTIAEVNDVRAYAQQETIARVEGDKATVQRIETYIAENDDALAAVRRSADLAVDTSSANAEIIDSINLELDKKASTGALNQVKSEIQEDVDKKISAQTTKIDGVYAQVNPDLAGSSEILAGNSGTLVGSWSLQSAMIEGDLALSKRVDTTIAEVNDVRAYAQQETIARVEGDKATVQRIETYIAENDDALAAVRRSADLAVDTSSANAEIIDSINLELDKKASTGALNQVKSEIQEDVDKKISAQTTKIDGVYAQINPDLAGSSEILAGNSGTLVGSWSLQSAMIEGDLALSKRVDTTVAEVNDVHAYAQQETIARVEGDKATVQRIETYIAENDDALAAVRRSADLAVDTSSSNAEIIDSINLELDKKASTGALNQVKSEIQEDVDKKISAQTTKIDGVYAQVNPSMAGAVDEMAGDAGKYAGVWSEQSARIEGDMAQAKRIDQVSVEMQQNNAVLKSEIEATATTAHAAIKATETMQTTVGENRASIEKQQQLIDGVYAQQYMKFDVNGHIVGHGSMNDGKTGNMIFNYDAVHFGAPVGVDGVQPKPLMSIQNKTVELPNGTIIPPGLYVSNGYFGQLDASKLWVESLDAITASFGKLKATSANIEDGAIKTAHIGVAEIDTLRVAGGAITANAASEFADRYDIPYFDTAFAIAEATINPAGGDVIAWFCFEAMEVSGSWTTSLSAHVLISIKRGNTVISRVKWDASKVYYEESNRLYPPSVRKLDQIMLPVFDKPPSGSHKYSVEFYISGWGNNPKAYIQNRKFILQGAKR